MITLVPNPPSNNILPMKRFLFLVCAVAILGSAFLVYILYSTEMMSRQLEGPSVSQSEFTDVAEVLAGDKPRIRIVGNGESERSGAIYMNVTRYCSNIQLPLVGNGTVQDEAHNVFIDSDEPSGVFQVLDEVMPAEQDVVICCSDPLDYWSSAAAFESFVAAGGKVILAGGLDESINDTTLWGCLGIQDATRDSEKDVQKLVFEKPLLPLQQDEIAYAGSSESVRLSVNDDSAIFISEENTETPVMYVSSWGAGSVCVINGMFLQDVTSIGLLSGALGAVLSNFVYPVLGVKAFFLDNFPSVSQEDNALYEQMYGYSAKGFIQDELWNTFQGLSLRSNTPCTASFLAESSFESNFKDEDDALLESIGEQVIQYNGELAYGADCEEGKGVVQDTRSLNTFKDAFPSYTVRGLVLLDDYFSSEMLNVPSAEIGAIRGFIGSKSTGPSWEEGHAFFPAGTAGSIIEDQSLFEIYSLLGAYGMVSHVFDVESFTPEPGEERTWDYQRKQIGILESEVLSKTPWLKGVTLSQTADYVRSYSDMEYGWAVDGDKLVMNCSNMIKGQAFLFHTNRRIARMSNARCEDLGNGYYLLQLLDNQALIEFAKEG